MNAVQDCLSVEEEEWGRIIHGFMCPIGYMFWPHLFLDWATTAVERIPWHFMPVHQQGYTRRGRGMIQGGVELLPSGAILKPVHRWLQQDGSNDSQWPWRRYG